MSSARLAAAAKAVHENWKEPRFRSLFAFYASAMDVSFRDLYWQALGVPAQRKADRVGRMRMRLGRVYEDDVVSEWRTKFGFEGVHMIEARDGQIAVSNPSNEPPIRGKLDGGLMRFQAKDGTWDPTYYVTEIKLLTSWGANYFATPADPYKYLVPKKGHLAQIGSYLKFLTEDPSFKHPVKGLMQYGVICDNNSVVGFEGILDIDYDPKTGYASVTGASVENEFEGRKIDPEFNPTGLKFDVDGRHQELQKLLTDCINPGKVQYVHRLSEGKLYEPGEDPFLPAEDFSYKAKLTPELLRDKSTTQLKKAKAGEVLPDFQLLYSDYPGFHRKLQGYAQAYSTEEQALLVAELYKPERQPKKRIKKS